MEKRQKPSRAQISHGTSRWSRFAIRSCRLRHRALIRRVVAVCRRTSSVRRPSLSLERELSERSSLSNDSDGSHAIPLHPPPSSREGERSSSFLSFFLFFLFFSLFHGLRTQPTLVTPGNVIFSRVPLTLGAHRP